MPTGAWSYTLNESNATVQALNAGRTLHELVTVATADGTTQVIDITINGTGVIETAGVTGLDQVANEFFLRDSGGTGPSLKYRGRRCRRPVRGVDADRGREGRQRLPGGLEERQRRSVHGVEHRQQRQLPEPRAWCQGPSMRSRSLEPTFQQDLNGDGGPASTTTTIETAGATGWSRWPTSSSCTTARARRRR